DLLKEREGKKGKEQEQRFDQWVSEDRQGNKRVENLHRDLFKVREGKRGKEQEQRSEQQVSEDRRGDRVWRIYTGIDMRKTSLKTDGETESRNPK
ncbi:hypothetical protein, partial [Thiolapillus sp.]|uniref:hypothetical protein n=3 Tax=Thiolapillus sp. TaxID=2017437 RepID=UPI0025EDE3AA